MNVESFLIPEDGLLVASQAETGSRYNCIVCEHYFSLAENLSVHYVVNHQLKCCGECSALFSTDSQLAAHTADHHSRQKCTENSFELNKVNLDNTKNNVGLLVKSCDICCETFGAAEVYRSHLTNYHRVLPSIDDINTIFVKLKEDTYFCQLCSLRFPFTKFIGHYARQHAFTIRALSDLVLRRGLGAAQLGLQADITSEIFYCPVCDQRYTKEMPKIMHMILCKGHKYCDKCSLIFQNENALSEHRHNCNNMIVRDIVPNSELCSFCDKTIKLFEWSKHRREIHGISDDIEGHAHLDSSNLCKFCDPAHSTSHENINALIVHCILEHSLSYGYILLMLNSLHRSSDAGIYTEVPGNVSEGRIDYDTRMVKFVYSSFDGTSSDESTTITRYTFVCKICEHKTISKLALINHMNKTHGFSINPGEFRCDMCKRKFRSNRTLRCHTRTRHWDTGTLLKCDFCEHETSKRSDMRCVNNKWQPTNFVWFFLILPLIPSILCLIFHMTFTIF